MLRSGVVFGALAILSGLCMFLELLGAKTVVYLCDELEQQSPVVVGPVRRVVAADAARGINGNTDVQQLAIRNCNKPTVHQKVLTTNNLMHK